MDQSHTCAHAHDKPYCNNKHIQNGNMLERMALSIAELKFDVTQNVEGYLYPEQYQIISTLLEGYKNSKNPLKPEMAHYDQIDKASAVYRNDASLDVSAFHKTHVSDYCFYDKGTNEYYIIEFCYTHIL